MLKTYVFIFCLLLLQPVIASAHPHVFVNNYLSFEFDSAGLAGIKVDWVFDEMFSAGILLDFDDGDAILSPQEVAAIEAEAFTNLAKFDYFIHLIVAGEKFSLPAVTEFSATVHNGSLFYSFKVPCRMPVAQATKSLTVRVEDDTNFASVITNKSSISISASTPAYPVSLTYAQASMGAFLVSREAVGAVTVKFSKL